VHDINKHILSGIGAFLRQRREELSYSQRDVANMTGLTVNSISAIEKGKNFSMNSFLLICRALQVQPKQVFKENIDLTPLYNLPPESRKRIETTKKLNYLVNNTDFFQSPKRVSEVLEELDSDKRESNKFSVYLTGYCKEGALEYIREGNIKKYKKKGK